jgi:hypothetical protein
MNEHVDYQAKKPSSGTKFLWWCAGADEEILKYSSYSDHVKYAGIGGVVLATGFLAAISMGFAMHTVFSDDKGNGNWLITVPIAIAWALIVFNLDRFIVSSTGKGDGESSISGKEFLNALPRLVMATLLGITIAAPLETVIFKTEIEREWKLSMDQLALSKSYEILQAEINNDSSKIENYNLKKEEVEKQRAIWAKANQAWEDQMQGRAGAEAGRGPRTIALERVRDEEKKKLEILEGELKRFDDEKITNKEKIKQKQEVAMEEIKSSLPGFLDKLMMLERLSSHGKSVPKFDPANNKIIEGQEIEIYGSAFWAIWLVRLLFMIVEIAPVLLKLMLIKGPYDYMSENVNQILETKQGISIYHMKDEHSQLHKLKRNHNPERIIAIIEHQNDKETENAKEAISAFAAKEKEQIRKNPDDFIQPSV